jgi:hypothetical protein
MSDFLRTFAYIWQNHQFFTGCAFWTIEFGLVIYLYVTVRKGKEWEVPLLMSAFWTIICLFGGDVADKITEKVNKDQTPAPIVDTDQPSKIRETIYLIPQTRNITTNNNSQGGEK